MARSRRRMSASRPSPRRSPSVAWMNRSWPASEVGAWRAGRRMSSSSDRPSAVHRRPAGERRLERRRSPRGSGCPRASGRSSTSSSSGPIAGFSLATRVSSSSSSRCSGGSGSGPTARELLAEAVEQALGVRPRARSSCQRGGHRAGPAVRLVARDEQVADLVEEPQRADVTGLDRGSSSGRALFIRLARRRMLARSATTRSPRTPSSGRPMPYRSRGSRRTWKSRISEASHADRRATGSGARDRPSGRRRLGRPAGLDVLDGASQQLEAGRVEVVGPRTDPLRSARTSGRALRRAPRATSG